MSIVDADKLMAEVKALAAEVKSANTRAMVSMVVGMALGSLLVHLLKQQMTISVYWLLLLFPAFALGFFTAALCAMAARQSDNESRQEK